MEKWPKAILKERRPIRKMGQHSKLLSFILKPSKKLENFGGNLLSEDDHSKWAPPYWNITKETFPLGRTEI